MKPRIGIAADKPRRVPKYQQSIEAAGGDVESLFLDTIGENPLNDLDGLLITGGGDVDASEFNETNHPRVTHVYRPLDKMELRLAREAVTQKVPVFGICRGMQVMNVALGGNLIQHIPAEIKTLIQHDDSKSSRQNLAHDIRIREGTLLHKILGTTRIGVNSFHHQAVGTLGSGLIATAWADDGVVEAMELPDGPYFLGVQWHPEEFVASNAMFHALFESFVEACK